MGHPQKEPLGSWKISDITLHCNDSSRSREADGMNRLNIFCCSEASYTKPDILYAREGRVLP